MKAQASDRKLFAQRLCILQENENRFIRQSPTKACQNL